MRPKILIELVLHRYPLDPSSSSHMRGRYLQNLNPTTRWRGGGINSPGYFTNISLHGPRLERNVSARQINLWVLDKFLLGLIDWTWHGTISFLFVESIKYFGPWGHYLHVETEHCGLDKSLGKRFSGNMWDEFGYVA